MDTVSLTRRYRLVLAVFPVFATAGIGCDRAGDPLVSARRYVELRANGDVIPLYEMLTTSDGDAISLIAFPDSLPPGSGIVREGAKRVSFDTGRVVSRWGDTAVIIATLKMPNYSRVYGDAADTTQSVEQRIREAPLVSAYDTLVMVREGDKWLVAIGVRETREIARRWDVNVPPGETVLTKRGAGARRFLASARPEGRFAARLYDAYVEMARDAVREGAVADSLEFSGFTAVKTGQRLRLPYNWVTISGIATNRGSRLVWFARVRLTYENGDTANVFLTDNFPPRSTLRFRTIESDIPTGRVARVEAISLSHRPQP
jgi:hypothetical protein